MNTTLTRLLAASFIAVASTAAIAAEEGGGDRGANNMNPSANDSKSYNTRMSNGSEIREAGRNNEYDASRGYYYDNSRQAYYDGSRRDARDERRYNNPNRLNANPTAGGGGLPASQEQKNSAGQP